MAGFLSPLPEGPCSRWGRKPPRGPCQGWRLGVAAALVVLFGAASARAEPRPLKDNHFSIDLFQGPILAPIDVTGISGAYAAYAEGIAAMVVNAAAPAVRDPASVNFFEMDGAGSISFPVNLFENNDFDNSGSIDYDYSNNIYGTLGGIIQIGPMGMGATAELQRYSLTDTQKQTTNVFVGRYHLLFAVRVLGDQLMLGAGARFATLYFESAQNLTMFGVAPELGILIRPDWQPFRLGATLRLPVDGGKLLGDAEVGDDGVQRAGGLILPEHVMLPWELEAGLALQVGPRPLNPAWIDPRKEEQEMRVIFAAKERERHAAGEAELAAIGDLAAREARKRQLEEHEARALERDLAEERRMAAQLAEGRRARFWNWPREHLLLTAEVLITGPVQDGVSIQGFLGQNQGTERGANLVGASGERVNFSPRFGVEGEPIPNWVHIRLGSYYEPRRFGGVGRQHFTFGADLKLFKTTWFGLVPEVIYKVQTVADLAPRYQSFSVGAGVWH
jgi:hypothetical protein